MCGQIPKLGRTEEVRIGLEKKEFNPTSAAALERSARPHTAIHTYHIMPPLINVHASGVFTKTGAF